MNRSREVLEFYFVLLVICAWFCQTFISMGVNNISSDAASYYEYFTRVFIDSNFVGAGRIKYPVGTTLLQLPFLLVTLFVSNFLGININGGQSIQFQWTIFISALFYYAVATVIVYKIAKEKYSHIISLASCVCLSLGTMIPVYVCERSGFSHIYGYFVCSLFFWYVSYYEKNQKRGRKLFFDIGLGAILGIAMLVRNTNIAIGFAYVFYGVDSATTLKERMRTIFSRGILVQATVALLILAVQMFLWRLQTGHWMLYSYEGEAFTYKFNPQVISVLFSDAKGLFITCPILYVGVVGAVFFYKENKEYSLSQMLIFFFITYFVSSWWCWWLGCSYSERMFCDVLCIFVLPLSAFFDKLYRWHLSLDGMKKIKLGWIPYVLYILVVVFVILNLTWISGVRTGIMHDDNFSTWYELKRCVYEKLLNRPLANL